jgi:hypothetical protein|tara:strand:- start:2966 stop:3565 length:600 start_codon:yes stop_codon:yes gene_type:complete
MKVLILAPGRCGSSVLADALSTRYNFNEYISEPFNYDLDNSQHDFDHNNVKDNTLVKCIVNQWHLPKGTPNSVTGCIEFFEEFTKQFDKVFLLKRESNSQRLFSVLHAHQTGLWGKYDRQDIVLDDPKHDVFIEDYIKTEIIMFTLVTKYDIITYENLYNKDVSVSRSEWIKIVEKEPKWTFNEYYNTWFNPKNRKKKC